MKKKHPTMISVVTMTSIVVLCSTREIPDRTRPKFLTMLLKMGAIRDVKV